MHREGNILFEYFGDRYKEIPKSNGEKKEHRYGPGQKILGVVYIFLTVVGLCFLINSIASDHASSILFGLTFLVYFSIVTPKNLLLSIVCQDDQLAVIYWVGVRREYKWEDIVQIRIVEMDGIWCRARTQRWNVDFPLSIFAGLESSAGLIRKIIDNSDFKFVHGTRGMLAVYKRTNELSM